MVNRNAKRICHAGRNRPNRKLQTLRLNAGLSPNQLAYRAGVSGPTVRLAERGHCPSPRVQLALASVFDLEPLDLFPLETQKESNLV
jgi:transcriptional regulator with XRE-family HTH domain